MFCNDDFEAANAILKLKCKINYEKEAVTKQAKYCYFKSVSLYVSCPKSVTIFFLVSCLGEYGEIQEDSSCLISLFLLTS